MPLTNLQLAEGLKEAFKKNATVKDGAVKVTLDKQITATELKRLASFCIDHNNYPTITRSGAGLSVVFNA